MIELKIDGTKLDLDQNTNIALTLGVADIEAPDETDSGYSKSLQVPMTPRNMRALNYVNDPYAKDLFNNATHTAEIVVDDVVVMSGVAQIEKTTYNFQNSDTLSGGLFHLTILGAALGWISSAKHPMAELSGGDSVIYTFDNVYKNSILQAISAVKFFPVDRGAFYTKSGDTATPRASMHLLDYHPFINVQKAFELIMQGYSIRTSLRPLFEKLYCAGFMPKADDDNTQKACDFSCGRKPAHPSELNVQQNVVKNFFNSWSAIDGFDGNGVLDSFYSEFDNWEPEYFTRYLPPYKVNVRFNIEVNFRSAVFSNAPRDVRFLDKFYFGTRPDLFATGQDYEHKLTVRVEDSEEYKERIVLSTGLNQTAGFYLFKISGTNLSQYTDMTLSCGNKIQTLGRPDWYTAWGFLQLLTAGVVLVKLKRSNGQWVDSASIGDFKFEMVTTDNQWLNFKLNYTTDPIECSPDNGYMFPCKFVNSWNSSIYTGFVELGTCTLKPVFGGYIGTGNKVEVSTVGGEGTQLDFIASIRQMFNLMFYTNPVTKEVFIEPRTAFYNLNRAEMIDLRAKVDYSKEITIEELGGNVGNALKLAYADGGEVVQYYNWKSHTELGAYTTPLLNKNTDEPKEVVNPIFAPFLTRAVPSVGMTLPQNEPESTKDTIDKVDLDITPIIGYFTGVANRTAGSDKAAKPMYPLLVFQDAQNKINLGFGNITGAAGLNKYYADNISSYNFGRRITAYLNLTPTDVEALQFPNSQMRDLRAVFLLSFDGEELPCFLESIEDYNPAAGASTKCRFITDPNIRLYGDNDLILTYNDDAVVFGRTAVTR